MRLRILVPALGLVAASLALPGTAEASHRHSRSCGHQSYGAGRDHQYYGGDRGYRDYGSRGHEYYGAGRYYYPPSVRYAPRPRYYAPPAPYYRSDYYRPYYRSYDRPYCPQPYGYAPRPFISFGFRW